VTSLKPSTPLASTARGNRNVRSSSTSSRAATTPREAAYLAKIIFGDLRTGVQEGVLHDAIAKAFERDRPTIQRCQLLVGDLGEVAVLAKHDACATAHFRLFHPIQFMLATPVEDANEGGRGARREAVSTPRTKLDGIRAQVHKSGGVGDDARSRSTPARWTAPTPASPTSSTLIRQMPGEFLLDGEIVPWCDGCVLPFAHIQKRLGGRCSPRRSIRDNPARSSRLTSV
jgi:DNA ligase-1